MEWSASSFWGGRFVSPLPRLLLRRPAKALAKDRRRRTVAFSSASPSSSQMCFLVLIWVAFRHRVWDLVRFHCPASKTAAARLQNARAQNWLRPSAASCSSANVLLPVLSHHGRVLLLKQVPCAGARRSHQQLREGETKGTLCRHVIHAWAVVHASQNCLPQKQPQKAQLSWVPLDLRSTPWDLTLITSYSVVLLLLMTLDLLMFLFIFLT